MSPRAHPTITVTSHDGPMPLPEREPRDAHPLDRPCANCARMVVSAAHQTTYCSDLCSQVAGMMRYHRKQEQKGTLRRHDIRDYLKDEAARIAGGGYPRRARRLSPNVRAAVIQRDDGRCRLCGQPGQEVDHIVDSSSSLENLQLLCLDCHHAKTAALMVVAAEAEQELVLRPLKVRAMEHPPRQPSDMLAWSHWGWIKGAKAVEPELEQAWRLWLAGPGKDQLEPAVAVRGFPEGLRVWAWYAAAGPFE